MDPRTRKIVLGYPKRYPKADLVGTIFVLLVFGSIALFGDAHSRGGTIGTVGLVIVLICGIASLAADIATLKSGHSRQDAGRS
jgi:protein-S-isoprenylcysteine O-methyltransferase Ste14